MHLIQLQLVLFLLCMLANVICALNILPPQMQLAFITDKATFGGNEKYVTEQKLTVEKAGTPDSSINYQFRFVEDVSTSQSIAVTIINMQRKKNVTIGKPLVVNICDFIDHDTLLYPGFREHSNFPAKCPIRAGVLRLENYRVPAEKFPPIFPTGTYIARISQMFNKEVIHELVWYGRVAKRSR